MRSALLGSSLPTTLLNIINGSKEASPLFVATLFTVTDLAGTTWSFNDRGFDINTKLSPSGPVITFHGGQIQPGIQTAESQTGGSDNKATIEFSPLFDNPLAANTNSAFLAGCHSGLFDGTFCGVYWAYLTNPSTVLDVVNIYGGWLGKIDMTRDKITWELNSLLFKANIRVPKRMYGAPCTHALYDPGCRPQTGPSPGPDPNNFKGTSPIAIGSIDSTLPQQILHPVGWGDGGGYYALGYLQFISGLNNNLTRTVKISNNSGITLMSPLPNTPQIGDQLNIYAGCDKTQNTCVYKFNNINNFGGFPYVPMETVFF